MHLHAIYYTGDIGGNIGLYLGGSILTLVEILDIVFAFCLGRSDRDHNSTLDIDTAGVRAHII